MTSNNVKTRTGADDRLTGVIIEAVIAVHQALGPGFRESIYRHALIIELHDRAYKVEIEKHVVVKYKGFCTS